MVRAKVEREKNGSYTVIFGDADTPLNNQKIVNVPVSGAKRAAVPGASKSIASTGSASGEVVAMGVTSAKATEKAAPSASASSASSEKASAPIGPVNELFNTIIKEVNSLRDTVNANITTMNDKQKIGYYTTAINLYHEHAAVFEAAYKEVNTIANTAQGKIEREKLTENMQNIRDILRDVIKNTIKGLEKSDKDKIKEAAKSIASNRLKVLPVSGGRHFKRSMRFRRNYVHHTKRNHTKRSHRKQRSHRMQRK